MDGSMDGWVDGLSARLAQSVECQCSDQEAPGSIPGSARIVVISLSKTLCTHFSFSLRCINGHL